MADEETPAEDAGTPKQDEEAPVEDASAKDEETPAADADNGVEETPAEAADSDADAVEAGAEDSAVASGVQPDGATSGPKAKRGVARTVAVVAGTVVASAAAIVGAVWAITAIVDDDDYRDCCGADFATSFDFDGKRAPIRIQDLGWDRDGRSDRFERDRSDRPEFERKRDHRERREHTERAERKDRNGKAEHELDESGDLGPPYGFENCERVLSVGRGDDAVTILVCNAPDAEWPEFEPGGDGDYFEFRKGPRAFRFAPFFGENSERPFNEGGPFKDGWSFGDGGPFKDGWSFGDGGPFKDGVPFDLEELYEQFFENGLPFDLEDLEGLEEFEDLERFGGMDGLEDLFGEGLPFDLEDLEGLEELEDLGELEDMLEELEEMEGLEDLFGEGERGFRFRGDGEDGRRGRFCFSEGEDEQCFGGLDQLSDEDLEQLERMMEMLDGFGLSGFFGVLEEFLDGLEPEFPESQTEQSGLTGA